MIVALESLEAVGVIRRFRPCLVTEAERVVPCLMARAADSSGNDKTWKMVEMLF